MHRLGQITTIMKFDPFEVNLPLRPFGMLAGNCLPRELYDEMREVSSQCRTFRYGLLLQQFDLQSFDIGVGIREHGGDFLMVLP